MEPTALLIVDDEATLLDLLRRYLEREGFAVTTCGTSEHALELFRASPQSFPYVITDLTLPGMGGDELAKKLRELNPQVRILITSGYPYQPQMAGVSFLQKPFLPKMLGEAIQQLAKKKL